MAQWTIHALRQRGQSTLCWRPSTGRLRLIQPGAALAKKFAALGCELESRSRMAVCRLHISPGDKPLQIAFLIAGKFGQVALPDVAEQRDLGFVRSSDSPLPPAPLQEPFAQLQLAAIVPRVSTM